MYPRWTTVTQGKRTYSYVHLVESYRRKDGKSVQRAIVNLGSLSRLEFENLQMSFRASRQGRAVVVADRATSELDKHDKVKKNLRYLNIAVMREMWATCGLDELLTELIGKEDRTIPTSKVVEILTLQRCVAPGSKLYAQEWFPTTALPELMAIELKSFNNARVHRALDALYKCTESLQERLPAMYPDQQPAFAAMFLDVTDTYFTGHGCKKAERSKTKEGLRNKYAIGIVLLANEKGYPLRWAVVPGKTKDHIAMAEMIEKVKNLDWAQKVPLVCDRAMGQQTSLQLLSSSGLHFLTAGHVDSIETFTAEVPWRLLAKAEIEATENSRKEDVATVVKIAEETKTLEKVDDHLFVTDLGVITVSPDEKRTRRKRYPGIQERLDDARELQARIDSGEFNTIKELAQTLELSPSRVSQRLRPFRRLTPQVQQFIETLPSDVPVTEAQLQAVLNVRDTQAQQKMLQALLDRANTGRSTEQNSVGPTPDEDDKPYQLRIVAYFNPQMFVDQRRRAREHREELYEFVAELNAELAAAKKTRKEEPTRRKIVKKLEKYNYLDLFDVTLEPIHVMDTKVASFKCTLECHTQAWERRQRYNGFVLLLAHPEMCQTARELAELYRAKDRVEKDFQHIKSVLDLRPIFHYTDRKVEAHVSLCMLGLSVDRTLEEKLAKKGIEQTASRTNRDLGTCHLNLMRPGAGGQCFYSVTEATKSQMNVLRALDSECLVDDNAVVERIAPRR